MWLRRWHTQRLRRVGDETFTGLIVPGLHEPSTVGDLHAIVDRYCATGRAEIHMGTADSGSLGPGWHHAEKGNNGHPGMRWSMAECWFYLQANAPWTAVLMTLVPQPRDTWAELWIGGAVQRLPCRRTRRTNCAGWCPRSAGRLVECRVGAARSCRCKKVRTGPARARPPHVSIRTG
jgi:hypothetical protein